LNNFTSGVNCVGNSANVGANAGYRQAVSAIQLTTDNHTGLTANGVNVFSFTSGSPKPIVGSTSTTGQFGDFFVYSMEIGTGAVPGQIGPETFTWAYDET
jgi:hypothetical protein